LFSQLGFASQRIEFSGLVVMLVAIVLAAPQFYVLASLADDMAQQATSALLSGAAETLAAFANARIVTDPPALLKAMAGSKTLRATVRPDSPPPPDKARSAPAPGEAGDDSPARLLIVATRVLHHEIGEKIALFIAVGGAFFANNAALGNVAYLRTVGLLLLLEITTDIAKDYAYSSRGVPTTRVTYKASLGAALALIFVSAASTAVMFASIRFECLAA
jgi:hypothetical protein